MSDIALVVIARHPEKGKVKTRLARSIGDEATLHLYRAFLTDLARRFTNWNTCDLHWAYTPTDADFDCDLASLSAVDAGWWDSFPQQGDALGERLHHIFHTTGDRHYQRTLVIASDSPHISRAIIDQAVQALDNADVVLGPAEDGGYYLIGMRKPHDLFTGIPMSTSVVLQMTIEKALSQRLSVHLLESLFDVDELPDLQRLSQLLEEVPELAPATSACLTRLNITRGEFV
jgi:rSAM/selenodomain-associated transferase 1